MIYCISDIHGEYGLFLKLMDKIGFNVGDRLYILGDIIDKGPDSVRLLNTLLPRDDCNIILGNHEYDFLKYYRALMRSTNDYDEVLKKLREYFPYDGRLLDWDMVDALENLPAYIEEEGMLLVHAGIPLSPDGTPCNLEKATVEQLVYDRNFKSPEVVQTGKSCVLYGHTPVRYLTDKDEFIFYKRNGAVGDKLADYYKIHLDTGVYLSGVLGCLRIDDMQPFYVKKNSPFYFTK